MFPMNASHLKAQHLPFNDVMKKINVKYLYIILIFQIMLMINCIIYIPNYKTTCNVYKNVIILQIHFLKKIFNLFSHPIAELLNTKTIFLVDLAYLEILLLFEILK